MVEIPKRGGGGGPRFGKNSQIIPYFFLVLTLLLLLFSLLFLLFLLLLFEGGCGRYPPFGLKNRFPVLVGVVVTAVVVVFVIDVVVVWRGLQVADGCGGSGAYAGRNRLAVVGMRYGPPSPIQPLLFSYWPTSQQVTLRALLSNKCNKTQQRYYIVRDVTNELIMGGLGWKGTLWW